MPDHRVKTELFDQFARIGSALASGRRIEMLDVLANGERSVEILAREVQLSVANTSRHLQVLKEAGLVVSRRAGTSIFYRLATADVYRLCAGDIPNLSKITSCMLAKKAQLSAPCRAYIDRQIAARSGKVATND